MKLTMALAVMLVTTMTSFGQLKDKYYVVRVYDHAKQETYEVMSSTELKELEQQCRLEKRCWPKATSLTAKAWKEMPGNERRGFPRGCVFPKSFTKQGSAYKTHEDATTKLDKILASVAKTEAKKAEAEKKKKGKSKDTSRADKKKAIQEKKSALNAEARSLFEGQLATVMEAVTQQATLK